jgi:hypothetical protein
MRFSFSVASAGSPAILLGLLIMGLAAPAAVLAFQPSSDAARYEVDRRGEVPLPLRRPDATALQTALSRSPAWSEFVTRHPGWVARWDLTSRIPERLQGPPEPVVGFASVDTSNAEAAARAFLRGEAAPWVPVGELAWVRTIGDRSGISVHFQQAHEGVVVWNSRVSVRLSRDGKVLLVTNRTYPGVPPSPAFRVAPSAAMEAAREALPGTPATLGDPIPTFLPIRRPDGYEQRRTWRYEFRTQDPPGAWVSFVDATDGSLLWRFNTIKFGEVHGQVSGWVEPRTVDDALENRPFPHLAVTCFPSEGGPVEAVTDDAGNYFLVTTGDVGRTAEASLRGPYGVVYDANTWEVASLDQPVPDGSSTQVDLLFGEGEAQIAERDAYHSVMIAHDFIQTIEPGFHALDYPMPIWVNIADSCNAYWDGTGVNFFAASSHCVNTARVADVIYHEYGHGITDRLTRPFSPSGAMQEGFSDYYAATIMGKPVLGIGFNGPGTSLRRVDEDRVFPQDWTGESHNDGLIIASALWDLREALGAPRADSLFHFARYWHSDNFDDYFFDLLMDDDDNGDVYDGTPNLNTICRVFRAHGVGDYGIHVSHAPMSDTEDTTSVLSVTASFLSVYALDPAQVRIHATVTHGDEVAVTDSTMTPTGVTREYTAVFPAQRPGTVITYYFTAADTVGTVVTWPEAGEADPFVFRVGTDSNPPVIVHEPLPDQPLDIDAIRVRAAVTDNLDQPLRSVNLVQSRNDGPPTTTPMTSAGGADSLAYIASDGLALGDSVKYRIQAEDGAVVPNIATEPASGWNSFRIVRGFERDFEAGDGGFQGDNDWEWGHSTLVKAYSGQNVWATNLDGPYTDWTRSVLTSAPLDLAAFTSAALVFRHYLVSEEYYDGGFVEISSDGGSTWTLANPVDGYPARIFADQGSAVYSRSTDGWVSAQFDLYRYLGQADVRIRFVFSSDQGTVALGWYLDDISVVERQIHGRPQCLQARSGVGPAIPLRWDPPTGLPAVGPTPVTGYNVYRAADKDGSPTLLNSEPLELRQYSDTTAVTDVLYSYFVSALYGNAESPLAGPAPAMAFVAAYAADLTSIAAGIDSSGVVDTTMVIHNAGSGFLELNAYLADTAQTIDDMRISILLQSARRTGASRAHGTMTPPVPAAGTVTPSSSLRPSYPRFDPRPQLANLYREPAKSLPRPLRSILPEGSLAQSSEWDTLATDPVDPPEARPDLAALLVRQAGDTLFLRVTAHNSMLPLMSSSSLIIPLDTDQNAENGYSGGEFAIFVGAVALDNFGAMAVLVDRDFKPTSALLTLAIREDGITFGLDQAELGRPWRIDTSVIAMAGHGPGEFDVMPNGFWAPWVDVSPAHLTVGAGTGGDLVLHFVSESMEAGTYQAKVLLETNDLTRPLVEIPVTFVVQTVTPIMLSGLTAEAGDEGVVLSWRTPADLHYIGFEVYRRQVSPDREEETPITAESLAAAADGEYRFVDSGVLPGREYEYRIAGLAPNGERQFFGPLTVTTPGVEPPHALWLAPCVPNPARRSTTVRYGIPRSDDVRLALYSPDGRLVHTVVEGDRKDAGYYVATWDGRDDRGHPVAAGVYLVRLETSRERRTQKMLWVR